MDRVGTISATYRVPYHDKPVYGVVSVPGSKSITNRALAIAALAKGATRLNNALFSDDSRILMAALRTVGYTVNADEASATIDVFGAQTEPLQQRAEYDLFVGNSGTSTRFLTALLALGKGVYRMDGVARMRERPLGDLLNSLRAMGVDVRDLLGTGCPPIEIRGAGLPGGTVSIRGDESSQFVSALLMAAPYAQSPLRIEILGELVSEPYVEMTRSMMAAFGVHTVRRERILEIPQGVYQANTTYDIEPDASGASYFMAAVALCGGEVTIRGLTRESLQGDVAFADVLEQMGCTVTFSSHGVTIARGDEPLRGVDVDLFHLSDTVPTLAAIAPFASSAVTIRNVANIRVKETDRIAACVAELRAFGVEVEEFADGMRISPCRNLREGVSVRTYDDHRMAMAFSLLGMRVHDTQILDPMCVSKTFPTYYEHFEKLLDLS
ncbi:3-phosphoshikimate 1-carboxyvinyltransferase [Ferroacidibacillus organovorans]|uniref:3-phosphoshikimate 1-carboxyvinyltransferase n=1 Tax=Ferroacidibacillus organovorans TaxID=1765683 RepID=A0A853KF74_9BACL|nr:3-phosphoshikimate 1-carboxyvinyltransferase [Ferroacidibacillus organovorans]KYP80184.1 3-phosphoshikimate 1-carboxyvinyltransferase [Ferroacidibacillus organovorans]OAG95061.1 3-phosphoshikimate 1-carboxyvinyltransferase [Ferroacidibacillus organovorans]